MTDAPRLRLGLVGAGRIAAAHLAAIATGPAVELAAVADLDRAAAEAAAATFGGRACGSHREMLDAVGLDAAIVCTPPASHAAIAIDLLGHGLHVLCEKPLATTPDAAEAMLAAAGAAGRVLALSSKYRHNPDTAAARSLIAEGAIGEPLLFECGFAQPFDLAGRWNGEPAIAGGGVIMDNGPHAVELWRCFFGAATAVLAAAPPRRAGRVVEDGATILLRDAAGRTGTIQLSWSLDLQRPDYVAIHGREGSLGLGWRQSWLRPRGGEARPFGAGYDKAAAFAGIVANFAAAVAGRAPAAPGAAELVANQRTIAAAYRSLDGAGWVAIPAEPQERP